MLPLWEPEEQRRKWGAHGGRSGSSFSPGRFIRRNQATHCSRTSCTCREKQSLVQYHSIAEQEGKLPIPALPVTVNTAKQAKQRKKRTRGKDGESCLKKKKERSSASG